MRMESFESEVIRIVTVEIVQLIKFLVQMHEGPELGYLAPTFKKRRKRGMKGERGRDGRMEGGRKKIKKEGRKSERKRKRGTGILLFIYNPNVGEKQVDT